jgi:GAF domain-containing protein
MATQTLQSLFNQLRTHKISVLEFYQGLLAVTMQRIGSTRASIWYFNDYHDTLTCELLYDSRTDEYSSGIALHQEDAPAYFKAMVQGDTICAYDALRHPLTAHFGESYFDPLDIKSLLDVSIIVKGKVVGVLCCEHCEHRKEWSSEDIEHLHAAGSVIALAMPMLHVFA